MKIETTTVTQTSNEILGTTEKTLYYLIVTASTGKPDDKMVINVGEKTHKSIQELIEKEEKFKKTVEELKEKHEEQKPLTGIHKEGGKK